MTVAYLPERPERAAVVRPGGRQSGSTQGVLAVGAGCFTIMAVVAWGIALLLLVPLLEG